MLYHLKHPDFPNIKFKVAQANFMVLTEGPDHFEDEVAVPPPAPAALPLASPTHVPTANVECATQASTTSKSNQTFHAMEECWQVERGPTAPSAPAEEHQVMIQSIWLDYELMLKVATSTCADVPVGVAHM